MNTNDMLSQIKKWEDLFGKKGSWLLFLCERNSDEPQILNQQYKPWQEALEMVLIIKDEL